MEVLEDYDERLAQRLARQDPLDRIERAALVEDKYLPELNPNVAMEWGWMRGMGRNVLYLVDKDFSKQRADWGGLIESSFEWANPGTNISCGARPKVPRWAAMVGITSAWSSGRRA